MRAEPRSRRPRFRLTGLEGPEELLDRLRESDAEVESLLADNARLEAELDTVRRRLQGVEGLTDDELAAELPLRMTRNLAAAQEVARDIIDRAKNEATVIRLNADQDADQLVEKAKMEAARIVRGTLAEAQARVASNRAECASLVQAAHAQRNQMLADLDERWARIDQEEQRLSEHRHRLEQAYDQVGRTLADARAALAAGAGASEAGDGEHPGDAAPVGRSRPERAAAASGATGAPRSPGERHDDRRTAGVFERSGSSSSSRNGDVRAAPITSFEADRYPAADAAAG